MIRQHRGALPPFTRCPKTISPSRKFARIGCGKSAARPRRRASLARSASRMTYNAEALPRRAKLREARRGRGNGGESSNSDQERAGYRSRSGSSPSHQPSPAGDDKAFGVAPNWPDCLGATAAYRTGAYNRCGLRCSRRTVRRHRRAALCRDLWSSGCLSRTRCCLATDTAAGLAPPMKTATRRSLRRAWRVLTWPLAGHIVFALGTGFACAVVSSNYVQVMAPPFAAIFGVFVLYPVMVVVWWNLHRPGGGRR